MHTFKHTHTRLPSYFGKLNVFGFILDWSTKEQPTVKAKNNQNWISGSGENQL